MREINYFIKKIKSFYIKFIVIILIEFLISFDISSLKLNYFMKEKKLYYINPINNDRGDLYFEHWNGDNNIRYFIGINITTGEDIYFGEEKIREIKASKSTYHASKIITDDKKEDHVFTININNYNLEFINLTNGNFSSKKIEEIFDITIDNYYEPSSKNSIIKLKDGNYLLSCIIYTKYLIKNYYNLYLYIFNFDFTKIGMDGFITIKKTEKMSEYYNTSICFQTGNDYIECTYNKIYILIDYLTVGVFDLNLNNKCNSNTETDDYIFSYILHVKNEFSAHIYFNNEKENIPKIRMKKLNSGLDDI